MTRKSSWVALTVILVVSVFGLLHAHVQQTEMQNLLSQLRSEDTQQRETAAKALAGRKQGLLNNPGAISEIENIVSEFAENEQRKGTAKTAIQLLGDLQSSKSVPLLVEHLTLRVFYKDTKRPQRNEDLFPSVGALIKIGQSSLDPVLARAEGTDDELVARCAAYVVKGVLKDEAPTLIRDRLAHRDEPSVRQRLLVVQKYIGN